MRELIWSRGPRSGRYRTEILDVLFLSCLYRTPFLSFLNWMAWVELDVNIYWRGREHCSDYTAIWVLFRGLTCSNYTAGGTKIGDMQLAGGWRPSTAALLLDGRHGMRPPSWAFPLLRPRAEMRPSRDPKTAAAACIHWGDSDFARYKSFISDYVSSFLLLLIMHNSFHQTFHHEHAVCWLCIQQH